MAKIEWASAKRMWKSKNRSIMFQCVRALSVVQLDIRFLGNEHEESQFQSTHQNNRFV